MTDKVKCHKHLFSSLVMSSNKAHHCQAFRFFEFYFLFLALVLICSLAGLARLNANTPRCTSVENWIEGRHNGWTMFDTNRINSYQVSCYFRSRHVYEPFAINAWVRHHTTLLPLICSHYLLQSLNCKKKTVNPLWIEHSILNQKEEVPRWPVMAPYFIGLDKAKLYSLANFGSIHECCRKNWIVSSGLPLSTNALEPDRKKKC